MIISANHELFHTLHQLSRLLTKETNQALQPFDLYSAQWAVIYTLHTKGAMTQTELRDYLAVEAPPLTRNVQRLVKKEIVKQVPGNDKRSKTIELTAYAKREYQSGKRLSSRQMNKCLPIFQNAPETA